MRIALIITLLALSIGIVALSAWYNGYLQLPVVPGWVFVLALVYIALQLLRGQLIPGSSKRTDLIYYLGLLLLALPAFLENPESVVPYRWLLVFGVASMIIPALIDLLNWKKEQKR